MLLWLNLFISEFRVYVCDVCVCECAWWLLHSQVLPRPSRNRTTQPYGNRLMNWAAPSTKQTNKQTETRAETYRFGFNLGHRHSKSFAETTNGTVLRTVVLVESCDFLKTACIWILYLADDWYGESLAYRLSRSTMRPKMAERRETKRTKWDLSINCHNFRHANLKSTQQKEEKIPINSASKSGLFEAIAVNLIHSTVSSSFKPSRSRCENHFFFLLSVRSFIPFNFVYIYHNPVCRIYSNWVFSFRIYTFRTLEMKNQSKSSSAIYFSSFVRSSIFSLSLSRFCALKLLSLLVIICAFMSSPERNTYIGEYSRNLSLSLYRMCDRIYSLIRRSTSCLCCVCIRIVVSFIAKSV